MQTVVYCRPMRVHTLSNPLDLDDINMNKSSEIPNNMKNEILTQSMYIYMICLQNPSKLNLRTKSNIIQPKYYSAKTATRLFTLYDCFSIGPTDYITIINNFKKLPIGMNISLQLKCICI